MTLILTIVFFALLVLAFPVGYALILAGGAGVMLGGEVPATVVLLRLFQPTQSFPLLAIPFFILAGAFLMSGQLGQQLVSFAAKLVGRFRGGLGQVNVVGASIFGGVSGSAVADASALGSIVIPWMKREGYPPALAAAITSSSSVIAVLIPPSVPLILYATVSNASIARLFIAGILPGVMLAGGLMLACYIVGRVRALPVVSVEGGLSAIARASLSALPAIMLPVLILVLLRGGIATPTEVSVMAVAYAFLARLVIYRDITAAGLVRDVLATAVTTGVVMLVIMASSLVGWILTVEGIPAQVAQWSLETLQEPWLVILMMNVIMLVVGMFLDLPAAILLLGPIFVAMAQAIGLDLVQLGLIMTMNLAIGLFTPPVGTTLFVAAAISRESIGPVVRSLWPFYLVAFAVLVLISYVPALTIKM